MADSVTVEQDNGPSFAPYFGLYHGLFRLEYEKSPEDQKRMVAVACALELIKTQGTMNHYSHLEYHMSKLSDYADFIQAALETKK